MSDPRAGFYVVVICSTIVTVAAVTFASLLLSRRTRSLSDIEAVAGRRRPQSAPPAIYIIASILFVGLLVSYATAAFRRGTLAMSGSGIMLAIATAAFIPFSMFIRDLTFEAAAIAFMMVVGVTWVHNTLLLSSGLGGAHVGIGWLLIAGSLVIASAIVRRPLAPASLILEAATFVLVPVSVQLVQSRASTPTDIRVAAAGALMRTAAWLLLHISGSLDLLRNLNMAGSAPCAQDVRGPSRCWPGKERSP